MVENRLKKLVLNQETLRNLVHQSPRMPFDTVGTHTCPNGACPSNHPPHCMGLAAAKQ